MKIINLIAICIISITLSGCVNNDAIEKRVNKLELEKQRDEACNKAQELKNSVDSVTANYRLSQTAAILDICKDRSNITDYKCVGNNLEINNEQELINNLRQNYGKITIEEVRENFNNSKIQIEELYIKDEPLRIEYNNAKLECENINKELENL